MAKDEYLVTVYTEKYKTDGKENNTGLVKPDASLLTTKDTRNLKSLIWSEPFQGLVWDEPYIIGLITDAIEVRVFDNLDMSDKGLLIQTIPQLQKARFLARGKKGLLYVASVSHLWCIQAVEISKQREHLLQEENFHLALQLTVREDDFGGVIWIVRDFFRILKFTQFYNTCY